MSLLGILFSWHFLIDGFKNLRQNRLVEEALREMEGNAQKGMAPHDVWNSSAVSLIKAAQAHARYFVVDAYVTVIKEGNFSIPVRRILWQLCELFLIYWTMERSGDFILVYKIRLNYRTNISYYFF